MSNFLKKIFYNRFFKNLKIIWLKKNLYNQLIITEFFSFFVIKLILGLFNLTPKTIGVPNNKTTIMQYLNTFYKIIYKSILLFCINILTFYLKYQQKFIIFFTAIGISLSGFIFLRHYIHKIFPELLQEHLIPNTAQILSYLFGSKINLNIYWFFEEILITYIFPLGGCIFLILLFWLNFDLSEQYSDEESFSETMLLLLLQTYTKNFIEDTQEEYLDTHIPILNELADLWEEKLSKIFLIFGLCTQQIWTIDLYNYWPFFKKRDNAIFEDNSFLDVYSPATFAGYDDNRFYYKKHFYTLVSYRDKRYGEEYLFNFTDVYNDYIKIILFKLQPLLEQYSLNISFFFILLLLIIIIELIMTNYLKNMTSFYFEQLTYNIYRPFLDQYFYSWYRLFINISQTRNQNFLIKTPYHSQYLDLFKFIPVEDDFQISIFEKLFNNNFNYFPTIQTIDELLFYDEDIEAEELSPIGTQQVSNISLFFWLIFTFCFIEIFRKNPLLISGRLNENLALFTPLTHLNNYSWLFQQIQNSSIFSYLNWSGWIYVLPKFLFKTFSYNFLFDYRFNSKKTKIIQNQYIKEHWWNYLYTTTPKYIVAMIKKLTITTKLKFKLKKTIKNFILKTIVFGQNTFLFIQDVVDFFIPFSLFFPKIKFKPRKPYMLTLVRIKLNLALKQKRLYLLRKKSSFINKKK